MTFERITRIEPGYDKKAEGYGIHCATLRMVLKGEKGAVQFVLYTGWYLHNVIKGDQSWTYRVVDGPSPILDRPQPADLGYHSPTPQYEGQTKMECEWIKGGCYYDGSSLNAHRLFYVLVHEGDEGVWRELEAFYRDIFNIP